MLSRERSLALDAWLSEATAGLCEPAIAEIGQRVRAEVEAWAEKLVRGGLPVDQAERLAVSELGNPDARKAEWRKLHIPPTQYYFVARYLKPTESSPAPVTWYHPLILFAPVILLLEVLTLFLAATGKTGVTGFLIVSAIILGVLVLNTLRSYMRIFEHWLVMPRKNIPLSQALKREARVFIAAPLSLLVLEALQLYLHTFENPPFTSLEEVARVLAPPSLFLIITALWLINGAFIKRVTRLEEQGFQYVVPESLRVPQADGQAVAPSRA